MVGEDRPGYTDLNVASAQSAFFIVLCAVLTHHARVDVAKVRVSPIFIPIVPGCPEHFGVEVDLCIVIEP
jgi:hypothetical protein